MNREMLSLAVGGIRDDHIMAGLKSGKRIKTRLKAGRGRSRKAISLLLAAAFLLALGVTAYAMGWLDSIFGRALEELPLSETEAALYEKAAAEPVPKEAASTELRDLPGRVFSLSEAYYDGKSLLLAYQMDSLLYPVEFRYGPEDAHFKDLIYLGKAAVNTGWQTYMTPEEYARVEQMMRDSGQCGFAVRYAYLGDHIRLTDGTDLGPWISHTIDGTVLLQWTEEEQEVPVEGGVVRLHQTGLPPAAQDRDELQLVFTIREILAFHYKDGEQFFYYYEPLGEEEIIIPVSRAVETPSPG